MGSGSWNLSGKLLLSLDLGEESQNNEEERRKEKAKRCCQTLKRRGNRSGVDEGLEREEEARAARSLSSGWHSPGDVAAHCWGSPGAV